MRSDRKIILVANQNVMRRVRNIENDSTDINDGILDRRRRYACIRSLDDILEVEAVDVTKARWRSTALWEPSNWKLWHGGYVTKCAAMGRPRKKNNHLPPCMYFKHGAYWYVKKGLWTRLPKEGLSTLNTALEAYALIHEAPSDGTMPALIDETLAHMAKRKPPLAKNTLKQYKDAAKILKRKLQQFNPEQVRKKTRGGHQGVDGGDAEYV